MSHLVDVGKVIIKRLFVIDLTYVAIMFDFHQQHQSSSCLMLVSLKHNKFPRQGCDSSSSFNGRRFLHNS